MGLFNFKQKAEIKRLEPTLIELGYIKRMNKSFGYRKQTTPNGYIEYSIYINKELMNFSWSIEDLTMVIEPDKIIETATSLIEEANNIIYLSGSKVEYGLNYIDFTLEVSKIDEQGIKEIHSFLEHIHTVYTPLIREAKPGELPFN